MHPPVSIRAALIETSAARLASFPLLVVAPLFIPPPRPPRFNPCIAFTRVATFVVTPISRPWFRIIFLMRAAVPAVVSPALRRVRRVVAVNTSWVEKQNAVPLAWDGVAKQSA